MWDPAIKDKRSTCYWDFEVVTENLFEIDVNPKYRMSLDTSCAFLLCLSTCHDVLCLCVYVTTFGDMFMFMCLSLRFDNIHRRDVHTP